MLALRHIARPSYTAEILQMLSVAGTNGFAVPPGSTINALDKFVYTIKAGGVLAIGDYVRMSLLNNTSYSDFARIPIKSPAGLLATIGADVIYTVNGFKGNNAAGAVLINTQVDLAATTNYVRNNASRIYVVVPVASNFVLDGRNGASDQQMMNANSTAQRINFSTGNLAAAMDLSGSGMRGLCRDDATNIRGIKGLVELPATATSVAIVSGNQLELRGFNQRGLGTICFTFYGGTLNTGLLTILYNALNTYFSEVGSSVTA